ncbi:hypothetical protein [Nonomuraea lactucae]|uniref:hypothetical protein n=1 Tax=Nonomuraea lactucae TaxID=2249762 RepID=UPI001962F2D3|nr:hypothetical protein [Nonomuraea lactucae]
MATVHRLTPHPGSPALGAAVEAFLTAIANRNTAKAYAIALRALTAELSAAAPLSELEGEAGADCLADWFTGRWGDGGRGHFQRPDGRARLCLRLVARSGLAG